MTRFLRATTFLAGLGVAALVAAESADARHAVVGLSPVQDRSALQSQAEQIIEHLIATVEPGESALIFDALNVELIGTFTVPDGEAYSNPRAKLQANRQVLADIKTFFEAAESNETSPGALDLPRFLRTLRAHYPSDEPRSIIVLGSPIYSDPLAPSWSMAEGRVPNDGVIAAQGHVSPFSTDGLAGTLEGDHLLFGVVSASANWAVSLPHAYHVERLWSLTMEAHGGSLAYFGDDLQTLLRLAAETEETTPHTQPLAPTDKLEMIQFFPDHGRAAEPRPDQVEEERDDPQLIDWSHVEGLQIRATWDCPTCDIDLYVLPQSGATALFYAQAQSEDGRLYKELRAGLTNGFERVVLETPADLDDMLIAVNLYARQPAGRTTDGPVEGQIELVTDQGTTSIPFTIDAETGDRGANWEIVLSGDQEPDTHWVVWNGVQLRASI